MAASPGSPMLLFEQGSRGADGGGHEVDVLTYFDGEDVAIPRVTIHRIEAASGPEGADQPLQALVAAEYGRRSPHD